MVVRLRCSRMPHYFARAYLLSKGEREGVTNYEGSMPYWECYYHLIWATYQRASLILPSVEPILYGALRDKTRLLNCEVLAANGVEDHIHLVLSMPPSLSISELVQQVKGFTSHVVNDHLGTDANFRWQVGYGVLTVGKQRISVACEYVNQQKEHHRLRTTNASLERIEE